LIFPVLVSNKLIDHFFMKVKMLFMFFAMGVQFLHRYQGNTTKNNWGPKIHLFIIISNLLVLPAFDMTGFLQCKWIGLNLIASLLQMYIPISCAMNEDYTKFDWDNYVKIDEKLNINELFLGNREAMWNFFIAVWFLILTFVTNYLNVGWMQLECFMGALVLCYLYGVEYFIQIRIYNLFFLCTYNVLYIDSPPCNFNFADAHPNRLNAIITMNVLSLCWSIWSVIRFASIKKQYYEKQHIKQNLEANKDVNQLSTSNQLPTY